jgi:hypothetical protein
MPSKSPAKSPAKKSAKRTLPTPLKQWNKEVKAVRLAKPSLSFKEALVLASKLRKTGKSPSKSTKKPKGSTPAKKSHKSPRKPKSSDSPAKKKHKSSH